ncbi:YdcF family protein, partial [Streptomyces fuscigenes]|uniref:YdcF family protein n=1 Tax=Streptomyces fuscigenes TaxID=1528880 RepID=UPI001F2224C7
MQRGTGLALTGTAVAAAVLWGEWLNRRWSHALAGDSGDSGDSGESADSWAGGAAASGARGATVGDAAGGGSGRATGDGVDAVVVLGYRNRGRRANAVNRWRVRAAARSVPAAAGRRTRVVLSGGAVGGDVPEARLMADWARSSGAFDASGDATVVLEEASRTTWENIANVIPLIEDADRIRIVSQPAHALKARAYLRRQRPDLAGRLVRAEDYRPGEWMLAKPLLALYGLWALRRLGAQERRPGGGLPAGG